MSRSEVKEERNFADHVNAVTNDNEIIRTSNCIEDLIMELPQMTRNKTKLSWYEGIWIHNVVGTVFIDIPVILCSWSGVYTEFRST